MEPPVVFSLLFSIHLSFLRPINRDYPRLSFDYMVYSANNTGKRYVFAIYIHKRTCNSLIFIPLLFCLSSRKIFRTKQGDYLCDIGQFLLNIVIIVNSFVRGKHSVFVIAIVTCECAISILQQVWFGVCHRY